MCIVAPSESGHGGRFEPCEEYKRLQAENAELRSALALILRHASAPDTAPPLRLSVQDCREIVRMVDNADPR